MERGAKQNDPFYTASYLADKQLVESLLNTFLLPVLVQAAIICAVFSPALLLLVWLVRRKEMWSAERELPFNEFPARPPGESLRVRITELEEKLYDLMLPLLVVPALIAITLATNPLFRPWPYWVGGCVLVAGIVAWYRPKLMQLAKALHAARLGFLGERVVGEALNQLMRRGYHVFQDVLFDQNNIDHVVVCRAGVFAVETKTRSVIREGDDADRGSVTYDGEVLIWPRFTESTTIAQAKRQACQLHDLVLAKTGLDVFVQPIVAIPGWDIARKAIGPVRIVDEKEISQCFPDAEKLSIEQVEKIATVLADKCRIDGDRTKLSTRDTKARQRFRFGLVKARSRTSRLVRG